MLLLLTFADGSPQKDFDYSRREPEREKKRGQEERGRGGLVKVLPQLPQLLSSLSRGCSRPHSLAQL